MPSERAPWATVEAPTLCAAFQRTAADHPTRTALRTVGGAASITYLEYGQQVERVAGGLAAFGLGHGDVVALLATNRPEVNLVDTAAMHLGCVPYSIYASCPVEEIAWLLEQSQARVVFTEPLFVEQVCAAVERLSPAPVVVLVEGSAAGTHALADLESTAAPAGFDFAATWRSIPPTHPVTLIYTSGTTGIPKGVIHSHASMLAGIRSLDAVSPIGPDGRMLSFLPMAHIAERFMSHYCGMCFGYTVTTVADPKQVVAGLLDARPTGLFAVPRVYEKIHSALAAAIAGEADPLRRKTLEWALDTGIRKVRTEQAGQPVPGELAAEYARADESVLRALRQRVGLDALEWSTVGAAPTPYSVLEFFHAIGVPVQELWGMSEILVMTMNPPQRVKLGTVGPAMPGVSVRLAEDGELLVTGPTMMIGYKDRPDLTAEAVVDGWMHTGDVAEIDADGYLRIVDRKKELIINSAGKNMAPSKIEAELKAGGTLIGQAVCIGDARLYNVALLTLDADGAGAWARANGVPDAPATELARHPGVLGEVAAAVARANERLSRVEQIKAWQLLDTEWLPGGEELTPTSKLRRKPIERKYADVIEQLYPGN